MNKAIFKKNIKWPYLVAFSAASIFLLAYTILGKAAYTIYRPIDNNGGQVNQTYLWAEETEINPNEWVTHKGLDFSYPTGTNVYAVADGTVIQLDEHYQNGERESPWGNYVLIRHTQQHYDRLNQQMAYVYSMYLHLSQNSIQVLPGQNVDADQFIAQVDDTGGGLPDQPAPHLHLQIVIHPLGDRTLVPNTLDANNRSRNPELWLSPYNGNTARAVGLITDASGNPLTDVIICAIVKPYGGYGFSRTYSYTWANPDDIFVENFGTTDITPGYYHLLAYPYTGPDSPCSGNLIKDLGWYTFSAGKTTFVGMDPVYIPSIRSTTSINGVDSSIIIRNNSTTDTARVITTLLYPGGGFKEQHTDYVNHRATITINPADSFTGSAIVVSSQDVSIAVTDSRQSLEAYAAYNGIRNAQTEVHVPIIHRNNSGWYNRVYIQNVGMSASTVTIHYYPALSGNSCERSLDINQNGQYVINTSSENCLGTTFIGSAYLTASEPLAVVWEQYKSGSASIIMSGNEGGIANTIYSPLIQNYNSNWVSGVAVQNASSSTNSLTIYFRRLDGTICYTDIHSNVLSRYSAIRYPPPPGCTTVLSGKITGGSLPVAANINQLLLNTSSATDYPAISSPGPKAYVPGSIKPRHGHLVFKYSMLAARRQQSRSSGII